MNPRYAAVAIRAQHRCEYYLDPELVFNFPFEVEHIIPIVLGGTNELSNLALVCRSCNLAKAATIEGWDEKAKVTVPLFNPRTDAWNDHFRLDVSSGRIDGRTPIGRVTTRVFKINSPAQLSARDQWIKLGVLMA